MKSTGTQCKKCVHGNKKSYENPCCWCISDEDIALAHMNPNHAVDFVHFSKTEAEE